MDANPEVAASLDAARATLGIPSFASRDEARRAYRALARAFHPDKGGDVNRFREVRKAHERLEAAWDASPARHPRDGSAADPVASPETKRDDGWRRNAPAPSTTEPNPVAPTRDLEALAAEAFDSGDYARARDILDAVIARALADERDGRDSPSSPEESKKEKKAGGLAEAFLSRARACAALGDWPSALVDADDALAHRGLWLEPHVVRAQALERLGRHREAEESYAKVEHLSESDSEDGSSFSSSTTTTRPPSTTTILTTITTTTRRARIQTRALHL
jgi:curved DNA-binding protein CbpA